MANNLAPEYNWSDRDQRHRFNAWFLARVPGNIYLNNRITATSAQPALEPAASRWSAAGQRAIQAAGESAIARAELNRLRGVAIDGVEPTYDTIAGGKYKGARKLYVYFKKAHIGVIPGVDKLIAEYTSEKALGADGYLTDKGLVALPKDAFEKAAKAAAEGATLKADELK